MKKNKKTAKAKKHLQQEHLFHNPFFQISVCALFLLTFYFSYSAFAFNYLSLDKSIERETLEKATVLRDFSALMNLGEGQPEISKVADPEYLKRESSFYRDVEEGDFVLAYKDTGKIYIYRPSENKLINFSYIVAK